MGEQRFMVGDRVRTIGGGDDEYIGVEGVIEADDGSTHRNLGVKLDKPIEKWGDTKIWRSAHHLEHVLLAPEQPATIKIEAGKFYKTRDGRKVGPMLFENFGDGEPWHTSDTCRWWSDDGTRRDGSNGESDDLIEEWIDEPAAKASNDNAAPKFKVGDRVVVICNKANGGDPIEAYVIGDVYPITSIIKDLNGNDAVLLNNHYQYLKQGQFAPESTITTTIIALIENGQPKPSSTPHVHASTGAAEKEAKRLAAKYKGKQFGVFTLTTTHEEAAPVYDHKWQNLAALGLKIDAIKELRALSGLGLKSAKDAVEHFLAAA